MFVKLLTPEPPFQVQVVFQDIVEPLRLTKFAHCEPDVAPDSPQRSSSREYWLAVTVSHCPQWEDVSTLARESSSTGVGEAKASETRGARRTSLENIVRKVERLRPDCSCSDEVLKYPVCSQNYRIATRPYEGTDQTYQLGGNGETVLFNSCASFSIILT